MHTFRTAAGVGLLILGVAGLVLPVNEPEPLPIHPLKVNKAFAVAVIVTLWPLLKNPLAGLAVPPEPAWSSPAVAPVGLL